MTAHRVWSATSLAVGLLLLLTGCPGLIANVVSSSESIQQAIDQAESGDVIRFRGSHEEDVTIDKDDLTLIGDGPEATIEGTLTVTGDRVTAENFTVDGDMSLDGDDGEFRDMGVAGVLKTPPGSFDDGMFETFSVGGWGFNVGGFGMDSVRSQSTVTLSGTFSCDEIVQPSESIQTAIDKTEASADRRLICVAASMRKAAAGDPNGPPLTVDKSVALQAMGEVVLNVTGGEFFSIVAIAHDNVRIDGLTLTTDDLNAGRGVSVNGTDVELTDLTITDTDVAVDQAPGASYQLRSSTLTDNNIGIDLSPSEAGVVVRGNTIKNHTTGIRLTGEALGVIDAEFTENNIVGNATGLEYDHFSISDVIVAENNWWGDASGPNDPSDNGETTDLSGDPNACTGNPASEFNSTGQGNVTEDDASNPVDYCPWATSAF